GRAAAKTIRRPGRARSNSTLLAARKAAKPLDRKGALTAGAFSFPLPRQVGVLHIRTPCELGTSSGCWRFHICQQPLPHARGRDRDCPPPPAQSRARTIHAYGSYLE